MSDQKSQKKDQGPVAVSSIKEFPHLKISKTVLKSTFFDGMGPDDFKKLLLNFKVIDYSNFPGTLTVVAIGAKNSDTPVPNMFATLEFQGDMSALNTTDLLYNTQEFSERKIENLVKINPHTWRDFNHLIFIPDIRTESDGKKYLYYKVQRRPIEAIASDEEITNPCPPNKPNDS